MTRRTTTRYRVSRLSAAGIQRAAERARDEMTRKLDAVARIEAALPNVQPQFRAEVEAHMLEAAQRPAAEIERWANMAEGYLSGPEPDAAEIQRRGRKAIRDLFGPEE